MTFCISEDQKIAVSSYAVSVRPENCVLVEKTEFEKRIESIRSELVLEHAITKSISRKSLLCQSVLEFLNKSKQYASATMADFLIT